MRPTIPVLTTVAILALTACGSDHEAASVATEAQATTTTPTSTTSAATTLAGVCPDTVVVQTEWVPQAEHGYLYQLAGPGGKADNDKKRYTAPLYSRGVDTGVKIEIRAGGPALSFQPVAAAMYADPSIFLGQTTSDRAIIAYASQPLVSVIAPEEISPEMIMFDPAQHDFSTIADIGKSDTEVLYVQDSPWMDFFLSTGALNKSQVNPSYAGTPDLFIASGGKLAQQGFITNDPQIYESLDKWGKPVKSLLIADNGYRPYTNMLFVRPAQIGTDAACLSKLVPMIQQAQIDYAADPKPTNQLIVAINEGYNSGVVYTQELADYSARAQLDNGVIANGSNSTLGDADESRLQELIDQLRPIYEAKNAALKEGLKPSDVSTNQFIDPTLGLP